MFLDDSISQIEDLLKQGTATSLTYAALECRLAIELICYQRLSHSIELVDLKSWQPRQVIDAVMEQADPNVAKHLKVDVADVSMADTRPESPVDLDYLPIGTRAEFDPRKLGALWNALSHTALHVALPTDLKMPVRYGDSAKIRRKVKEALAEIRRVNKGTLIISALGEEIRFNCQCGAQIRRKSGLLQDRAVVACLVPTCDESYLYVAKDGSFIRQVLSLPCPGCGETHTLPWKQVQALRVNIPHKFGFPCGQTFAVCWKLDCSYQLPTTRV